MPFAPEMSPSLALSLLKASLAPLPVKTRVLYFTLRFAEAIGVALYTQLSSDGARSTRERLGDWVFRPALFGVDEENDRRFIEEVLVGRSVWPDKSLARTIPRSTIAGAVRARQRVDRFLDRCVEEVLSFRPRLVGFTSVFQQHVASLALAKRLKAESPGLFIVFGGANCEDVMGFETVRSFPFVDAAISGEGEVVFPELVDRVLSRASVDDIRGVRTRAEFAEAPVPGRLSVAPAVSHMDHLPRPDFEDFFDQFGSSRLSREWEPGLFFETSRGCWWGEKSHCSFCGLNGGSISFRSKSPGRALDELTSLVSRHPGCDVQIVDNILDNSYFDSFLPALGSRKLGVKLFYETKANLSKDQVRILAEAGIAGIQPGIESLSDTVLRLMRKGVTALQNVQLLKWCRQFGVVPYWNVIWGFPGEPSEEYERMAEIVPLLEHLPPPRGLTGLRLDRFSPSFTRPEAHGFIDVEPLDSYRFIYPLGKEAVRNLAYFFRFGTADGRAPASYVGPLLRSLRTWRARHPRSGLFFAAVDERLVVWDLRACAKRRLWILEGLPRSVLLRTESAKDVRKLSSELMSEDAGVTPSAVDEAIDGLRRARLLLEDRGRVLALPLEVPDYVLPERVLSAFWSAAAPLGAQEEEGLCIPVFRERQATGLLVPARGTRRGPLKRSASSPVAPSQPRFRFRSPESLVVSAGSSVETPEKGGTFS